MAAPASTISPALTADVNIDVDATATTDTSYQSDDAVTSFVQPTNASAISPTMNSSIPELTQSIKAEDTMSDHTYQYKVKMTCGGCSGAIERALGKAQREGAGIDSYIVSLENQSVEVKGSILQADLTARIAKTGKKIEEEREVTEASVVPPVSEPVAVA